MELQAVYQKVLEVDKDRILDETISLLKRRIIELNQWQLSYGLNAKGGRFKRYRNKYYAAKKNRMNSRPGLGNPDLKLTGAFWSAFKIDIRARGADIYSTDPKAEGLDDKYASIYGLTAESMSFLRAEALVLYTQKLKAELGLQ